jgi:hypothetical protein
MPFKHHEWIVPLGIGIQFFLTERAVTSVVGPIGEMISIMAAQ